jgi:NADH:ubiquinone oxidoreductase subunit D
VNPVGLSAGVANVTIKSEPFVVNLGPQHPSTHGVFRLRDWTARDHRADMVMGYRNRSMEAGGRAHIYAEHPVYRPHRLSGRDDGEPRIRPSCGAALWHRAPERAHWLRTIMCELQRSPVIVWRSASSRMTAVRGKRR